MRISNHDLKLIRDVYHTCLRHGPSEWSQRKCWDEAHRMVLQSRKQLQTSLRQPPTRPGPWARRMRGLQGLSNLGRVRLLPVQGYRDGNKAWIDVFPPEGPRMRITHEVLADAGFGRVLTRRARAKLPAKSFALPGRRFPVQDCSHARNALSRASLSYHRGNLTRGEHQTVVRKARAAMRRHCT